MLNRIGNEISKNLSWAFEKAAEVGERIANARAIGGGTKGRRQGRPFVSLWRACIGVRGDRARYESRDVFIVSLPELFLHFLHTRCAAEIYGEWLEAEVIIGCKHRRGTDSTSRWR